MSLWRYFLIVVLLVSWPLAAGEPPTRPILRLEPGMHTAKISRIAVDRGERWLVTASDDKTARVWDLQTGALLTILHPPIGEDADEGKLYTVAISPDGETVAVGGYTGYAWDGKCAIYLFDRASGRLLRRLTGLPNAIFHLTFSVDGHYLAATLGQNNGLRVYRTGEWREVFADSDYEDGSYWADFAADGRLVASSWDGYVRLYDARFKLVAKVKPPGGSRPYGVAFSPDGQRIAVGFRDIPAVTLLSGTNLTLLSAPDITGVTNGILQTVAWSQDGQWLYAGGIYHANRRAIIRRWANSGKGKYQDFPATGSTLMSLNPLSGGRLAFGAGDPAWGVMDAQGRVDPQHTPSQADLRGNREGFRLSRDGLKVSFGTEYGGKRSVFFDLTSRALTGLVQPDQTLDAPRLKAPGLEISDWLNTTHTKLNGQPLTLKPYETSSSLAITLDGAGFLLGTNWSLYRFDRQGKQLWQQSTPEVAWAVNISGDGRLAVAGYGDGTVRWYRMEDGKEILALFVHSDGKRWVAWTPEGYYMASPGGEELMGWQLRGNPVRLLLEV